MNGSLLCKIGCLLILATFANSQTWSPNTNYYLKWVTNKRSDIPIWLEHHKRAEADYKWFKFSEHSYVDEIENYQSHYAYSDTPTHTKLYIMNYDTRTHEQLSTYEPKAVTVRSDNLLASYDEEDALDDEQRDLYTLAYLKSHRLTVEQSETRMNISCSVVVIIPQNEEDINEQIYKLLESNMLIKMKFNSNHTNHEAGTQHESKKHSNHPRHQQDKHQKHHTHHTKLHRKVLHRFKRDLELKEDAEPNKLNEFFKKLTGLGDSTHRIRRQLADSYESNEPDSRVGEKIILTNLIEVELREGPISIHKEFNEDDYEHEQITCQLDLIDYDHTSAYHNKIHRNLKKRLPNEKEALASTDDDEYGDATSSTKAPKVTSQASKAKNHVNSLQLANTGMSTARGAEIWPVRVVENLFFKYKVSRKFKCMMAFFGFFTLFNLIFKLNHNIQY